MRDYGAVPGVFWTRGAGRQMRGVPHAQLVAVYVLSAASMHMCGVAYLPIALIAQETGLTHDEVRAAFARLQAIGFLHVDEGEGLVWVPLVAELSFGERLAPGDKRTKPVEKHLAAVAPHRFVDAFRGRFVTGLTEGDGMAHHMPHPMAHQVGDAMPQPMPVTVTGAGSATGSGTETGEREAPPTAVPALALVSPEGKKPKATKRESRASRLPEGWKPSESTIAWGRKKGVDALGSLERFTLHWQTTNGKNATKRDWDAALKIWILRDIDDGKAAPLDDDDARTVRHMPAPRAPNPNAISADEYQRRINAMIGGLPNILPADGEGPFIAPGRPRSNVPAHQPIAPFPRRQATPEVVAEAKPEGQVSDG